MKPCFFAVAFISVIIATSFHLNVYTGFLCESVNNCANDIFDLGFHLWACLFIISSFHVVAAFFGVHFHIHFLFAFFFG